MLDDYREVWVCDSEYSIAPGERPKPVCFVFREARSGRLIRLFADDLARCADPPIRFGPDVLFVAFVAQAELGIFRALGWPMPTRILDLFAEFRCLTNGQELPAGKGLLGAAVYFGLDHLGAVEKDAMRKLAMCGGPYTADERRALLDYCQADVDLTAKLLLAMADKVDLPRALLRGRYTPAVSAMEWEGVPIDTATLAVLREHWGTIKGELIEQVDRDYGVYIPTGSQSLPEVIRREAADAGVDALTLAETCRYVAEQTREAVRERREAISAARRATGLTPGAVARWEDGGKDSSRWPGLDTDARTLAKEYPALGIGAGYAGETAGDDDADYAGGLWELLRGDEPKRRKWTDAGVIAEALELLASHPQSPATRPMSFSADRFARWLAHQKIEWPRHPSGVLDLSDNTFREMAKAHPIVAPLRELRHTLGELRLFDLAVGADGRNRCSLWPFSSKTGRNQPSNSAFIFGPSCWLRGLIQPKPGRAVAYLDFKQQEFGIAAALSGDAAMQDAYRSGDPYLAFAVQAGAAPKGATKETHGAIRDQFKACVLAVQYGMGERSLGVRIGQSSAHARELLRLHRQTYPKFWRWSEAAVALAQLEGRLWTVFGWEIRPGRDPNPRSLSNFPCQSNGAEMLRLACSMLTEAGVAVCCPVHDAVLIEAAADDIDATVTKARELMEQASEVVLDGFRIGTDAKIVRYPERYMDPRGEQMWRTIGEIVGRRIGGSLAAFESEGAKHAAPV